MMAACNNIESYAAAQVFYWVGFNGIAYVLDVFIADTSSLKWRGLMFAFANSPFIVTTFAGAPAAQSFYYTAGWRWAFGAFAVITPAMSLPFLWVFWNNQRLARKQGVLVDRREASGRTWYQSLQHYLIEFDCESTVSRVTFLRFANKASSHRHDPPDRRLGPTPPPPKSSQLRHPAMALPHHHCDASNRLLQPDRLRPARAILRPQALPPLPLPTRPHRHRLLHVRRHVIRQLLLLGPLLPVLPASRLQPQHHRRRLRLPHLQPRVLLLGHCRWIPDPSYRPLQVARLLRGTGTNSRHGLDDLLPPSTQSTRLRDHVPDLHRHQRRHASNLPRNRHHGGRGPGQHRRRPGPHLALHRHRRRNRHQHQRRHLDQHPPRSPRTPPPAPPQKPGHDDLRRHHGAIGLCVGEPGARSHHPGLQRDAAVSVHCGHGGAGAADCVGGYVARCQR